MTMSEAARKALINASNGSTVDSAELAKLGLVGPNGGLTRKGSIARERAVRAAEDAAFA